MISSASSRFSATFSYYIQAETIQAMASVRTLSGLLQH
jgi:hypothetical protein